MECRRHNAISSNGITAGGGCLFPAGDSSPLAVFIPTKKCCPPGSPPNKKQSLVVQLVVNLTSPPLRPKMPKRSSERMRGVEQKHRPHFHTRPLHNSLCSLGWSFFFSTRWSNDRRLIDWFSSPFTRDTMKAKESQPITFKELNYSSFFARCCL